jgi:DNA-binding response OmpR family regulator
MSDSLKDATLRHIPRILIIEDHIELAEIIQVSLRKLSVVTFVETSGEKALEMFDRINPQLVMLDIGLPDMTGWKVLDAIKERRGEDARPVIVVLTAYSDPANRLMGKLQGVHEYIIKPFTPQEIQRVVTDVLGTSIAKP